MKRGTVRACGLLAGLLTGLVVPPALAQDAPVAEERRAAQPLRPGVEVRIRPQNQTNPAHPQVDDSALRYHASRGDRVRVEAEIERLRRLHPQWEPPADLYGPVTTVDERPLWELYEDGNYAEVRAAVADLRAANPDWSPPARLLSLMEENEIRARLAALEHDRAWQRLLEVAEAYPAQVACGRIDNMWRVARAHAELGRRAEAYQTYARIIESCPSLDHRIATLQKASGQLERGQLADLFKLEQSRDKAAAEAARVERVRDELTGPTTPPAIQALFRKNVPLSQAERAGRTVLAARHAPGAERLGWLYYDAGRPANAVTWFGRAHAWAPNQKTAEGLARAHAALGRFDQVERLARDYPALQPMLGEVREQALAQAYADGDFATVLGQTASARDAAALTMRGWTMLQLERPTEAAITFERVVDDDEAKPSERRRAAFGLARARLATGNLGAAEAIAQTYRLPREELHEIKAEVLMRRADRAYQAQDYRSCVALLEQRRSYADPSRAMLVQEAWARYHLGQKTVAARIFETLNRIYADPDSEEGLRVVNQQINRYGL